MKKIKLLTPLLGVCTMSMVLPTLAGCSCTTTEDTAITPVIAENEGITVSVVQAKLNDTLILSYELADGYEPDFELSTILIDGKEVDIDNVYLVKDNKIYINASAITSKNVEVNIKTKPVGYVHATGVVLDKTTMTLDYVDGAVPQQLNATVYPETATNKNVTWTSSDESIAKVDETGLVTGVSAGTVEITATTEDLGKTAVCKVSVNEDQKAKFIELFEQYNNTFLKATGEYKWSQVTVKADGEGAPLTDVYYSTDSGSKICYCVLETETAQAFPVAGAITKEMLQNVLLPQTTASVRYIFNDDYIEYIDANPGKTATISSLKINKNGYLEEYGTVDGTTYTVSYEGEPGTVYNEKEFLVKYAEIYQKYVASEYTYHNDDIKDGVIEGQVGYIDGKSSVITYSDITSINYKDPITWGIFDTPVQSFGTSISILETQQIEEEINAWIKQSTDKEIFVCEYDLSSDTEINILFYYYAPLKNDRRIVKQYTINTSGYYTYKYDTSAKYAILYKFTYNSEPTHKKSELI